MVKESAKQNYNKFLLNLTLATGVVAKVVAHQLLGGPAFESPQAASFFSSLSYALSYSGASLEIVT